MKDEMITQVRAAKATLSLYKRLCVTEALCNSLMVKGSEATHDIGTLLLAADMIAKKIEPIDISSQDVKDGLSHFVAAGIISIDDSLGRITVRQRKR